MRSAVPHEWWMRTTEADVRALLLNIVEDVCRAAGDSLDKPNRRTDDRRKGLREHEPQQGLHRCKRAERTGGVVDHRHDDVSSRARTRDHLPAASILVNLALLILMANGMTKKP
eukprot:scaffold115284_cov58-Phaeocystis_antarctica.AAC.1